MTRFSNLSAVLLSTLLPIAGFAATHATQTKAAALDPFTGMTQATEIDGILNEPEQVNALAKKFFSERNNRTPDAAITLSERSLSDKYIEFEKRYFDETKIKTPADFAALLEELDKNYDGYPEDMKLLVARITPLRQMGGFFWRVIPILSKARMTQEIGSGALRAVYSQMAIKFPDNVDKVVFQYLTQPQPGLLQQFTSERDLQVFAHVTLYPALKTSIKRIEGLNLAAKPVVFDARLRFGEDSFPGSSTNRFHLVGEAERFTMLSRLHRRLFMIAVFCAYDLDGLMKYRAAVGKKLGVDVAALQELNPLSSYFGDAQAELGGITRETRVAMMKKFPNLYKLRSADEPATTSFGKRAMVLAYSHFRMHVSYLSNAWKVLQKSGRAGTSVLDPEFFESRKEQIGDAMEVASNLVPKDAAAAYPIHSNRLGSDNVVHVNVRNFFYNPPADLKNLLPNSFDKGDTRADKNGWIKAEVGGKSVIFRDYAKGRAIGWNVNEYKKLFPDAKNPADIATIERNLNSTLNGRLISGMLVPFVR